MADINKLLQTIDLRKAFNVGESSVEVLKGINVHVEQGEFVIIFGPSGSGKSTLLHSLLGLEVPTSGKVLVDNKDYYSMIEDERAMYRRHNIGIIYQQPLWVSSFSVIENVCLPLYLLDVDKTEARNKAMQTLVKMGMDKWADYVPTELSSGQQQKISLARSLMIDPKMIIADEPTGNLDTVSGQELLDTFITLIKEGKSIVMVTHDLEYLKYATRIFHMIDGQVVKEYSPKNNKKSKKVPGDKQNSLNDDKEANVRDPNFLDKLQL